MRWNEIIRNLLDAGLTQVVIAEAAGRTQSWVADVLAGRYRDVKWADGETLLCLHEKHCAVPPAPTFCEDQ